MFGLQCKLSSSIFSTLLHVRKVYIYTIFFIKLFSFIAFELLIEYLAHILAKFVFKIISYNKLKQFSKELSHVYLQSIGKNSIASFISRVRII